VAPSGFFSFAKYLGFLIIEGFCKLPKFLFGIAECLFNGFSWLVTNAALYVPQGLAPLFRYGSRSWQRSRQKQTSPLTQELHLWRVSQLKDESHPSEVPSREKADTPQTVDLQEIPKPIQRKFSFLRLLSSEDGEKIRLKIIMFLHYTDVVNLSLTSKNMRAELFGSSLRVEALRIASCIPMKSGCYYCNTQICEVRVR
jgi:hypothetical protein